MARTKKRIRHDARAMARGIHPVVMRLVNRALFRVSAQAAKAHRRTATHSAVYSAFRDHVRAQSRVGAFQGVWLFAHCKRDNHGGWLLFTNTGERGRACKHEVLATFSDMSRIIATRGCDDATFSRAVAAYRNAIEHKSLTELNLNVDFSFGQGGCGKYEVYSHECKHLCTPPMWSADVPVTSDSVTLCTQHPSVFKPAHPNLCIYDPRADDLSRGAT